MELGVPRVSRVGSWVPPLKLLFRAPMAFASEVAVAAA